jgi:hypothetical protein
MNKKTLVASLAVLSLVLGSACGGYDPRPGDVTFLWSFYGLTCAEDPAIEWVQISIPGENLDNDGFYPCNVNGSDGIVLHDFYPGTYSFAIDAIDYDGYRSYTAGGTFTVDGDTLVRVDLTPTY